MICPRCNSEKTHKNGKDQKGMQKYKCSCGYNFDEGIAAKNDPVVKHKNVFSLSEIRKLHDVDYRVVEALKGLLKDEFIEKDELVKRIGLRNGYPRLSATIDSHKEYFGKADSKIYWGHPDDIATLKEEGTFT